MTLGYNANGYLTADNISGYSSTYPNNAFTLNSTPTYYADNLLAGVTQPAWNYEFTYDDAKRVVCANFPGLSPTGTYMEYDASGHRQYRYANFYGNPSCSGMTVAGRAGSWGYNRTYYTYTGEKLTHETTENCAWGACTSTAWTRDYTYDAEGNLTQAQHIEGSNTYRFQYTWEPGTHRLMQLQRFNNSNLALTVTFEYDRVNRIRQFCYNGGCTNYTYVGETAWLAYSQASGGGQITDILYANGRPLRAEQRDANGNLLYLYYYQYNYHGDVVQAVDANGGTRTSDWIRYGGWGEIGGGAALGPYAWNGAWGYWRFPNQMNFDLHDNRDQGLYFVHGRWYNHDTGLFLSPDENGSYQHNDQDAVNYALTSNIPAQQTKGVPLNDLVLLHYMYVRLSPSEHEYQRAIANSSLAQLAAYMAVGEMEQYCRFGDPKSPNGTPEEISRCKAAFGAVIITVKNRFNCIKGNLPGYESCDDKWEYWGRPQFTQQEINRLGSATVTQARKSQVTYGGLVLGGCEKGRCDGGAKGIAPSAQYNGLDRWIIGDLSMSDAQTKRRYDIAEKIAWDILFPTGVYTPYGTDIGRRTYFRGFGRDTYAAGQFIQKLENAPLGCILPSYANTTVFCFKNPN
jgi:YD repeat-containing protein